MGGTKLSFCLLIKTRFSALPPNYITLHILNQFVFIMIHPLFRAMLYYIQRHCCEICTLCIVTLGIDCYYALCKHFNVYQVRSLLCLGFLCMLVDSVHALGKVLFTAVLVLLVMYFPILVELDTLTLPLSS